MTIDSTAAEPTTKLTRKRYPYRPLTREKQDAKNKKQRERNQKNPKPLTREQKDAKNKKQRERNQKNPLTREKQDAYNKKRRERLTQEQRDDKNKKRRKKAMSPSTGPSSIEAVAAAEVQAQAEEVAAAEVQAKSEAAAAVEGKAQAEAVAAQEPCPATVRARQVEEEEEEEREIRRGQKSDAAKATAAAAVTDDEEKESESEEDAANKATEKAAKKAASKIKTIELNSILSAANSSILRNGLYNGDKFYFHAGVNNNDNGATAGEAPSFNFRTEDNVVYTFSRWSRAFTAMNHEIRGAAPSSSLKHGAGRDTKLLNGLGQHSSDDCCVLVFSVIGKTTAAAVQFLEETTVNKGKLKVEFQNVIDTVKQYWPHFDEIILPWFTTTKHYVAVSLCRDQQNGNGYIRLSIPTSCNSNGHFSTILEENSLTMNQISCTVYSPILCRMIKHASHTGHTRIQFYSANEGYMPLHQDSAGERAHEYIKCSYMETGVGLTYSK